MRHIGLFMKVTHKCNLKCVYCYDHEMIKDKCSMSIETFKHTVNLFAKDYDSIAIMFHGGEPLVNGVEWYKEALAYCNSFKDTFFTYSMQSNGVLLNESFLELIKKYNIGYSMSFDGIHTSEYRLVSNDKILDKAKLFEEKMERKIGLCAVCNEKFLNNIIEEYEYFKEYSIGGRFNYLFGNDVALDYYDLYIEKMNELFDYWLYDKDAIDLSEMTSVISLYTRKPDYNSACLKCHTHWIGVDWDGLLGLCDFGINSRDDNMGNIYDYDNALDIVYHELKTNHIKNITDMQKQCFDKKCVLAGTCTGGCNAKKIAYPQMEDYYCHVMTRTYEHAKKALDKADMTKINPIAKRMLTGGNTCLH